MSQQNARTPSDFIRTVQYKFNVKFIFDLACTTKDCVVRGVQLADRIEECGGYYFDLCYDALEQDWSKISVPLANPEGVEPCAWLNPPWKNIWRWADKCNKGTDRMVEVSPGPEYPNDPNYYELEPGIRIFSLFPAGVGTKWFSKYVHGVADVYFLHPRITYLDPRTGMPFIKMIKKDDGQLHPYRDKYGKTVPQTGLNDAILCDWQGTGQTYCWDWKQTLNELVEADAHSVQDALNRV